MRTRTGIIFNDIELLDGDIVVQNCKVIDDYTGKPSIELNRLLICWNGNKWDVKCLDAMIGYRDDFWGYIPRFDDIFGNAIDNKDMLCGGINWNPKLQQDAKQNP